MAIHPSLPPFNEAGPVVTILKNQTETITREFSLPKPSSNTANAYNWSIHFEAGSGGTPGVLDLDVQEQGPDGTWADSAEYPTSISATDLEDFSKATGRKTRVVATITQTSGAGMANASITAGVAFVANPVHGEILEVWDGVHPTGPIRIGFYQTAAGDGTTPAPVHKKGMNLWMCPISGTPGSSVQAEYEATRALLQDILDDMQTEGYWRITNTVNGSNNGRIDFDHDIPGTIGNSAYVGVSSQGAINATVRTLSGGTGTATTCTMQVSVV